MKHTFDPCPEHFNAAAYVLAASETTPHKTALILASKNGLERSWTYERLAADVRAVATGFSRRGLKPGDKIILRLGNTPLFPIAFLAAITMGAIPVPTSSALTPSELDRILADLGDAKAMILGTDLKPSGTAIEIITEDRLWAMAENPPSPFVQTMKDDPAYIVYTSGSSGLPKGVVHAHRAIWARRMMWSGWYDLKQSDRMLHAGAFNWTFTLGTGLMDPWAIGATAIVYSGAPSRHIWSEIARSQAATLFAAAPGVFRQLLTSPRDLAADFGTLRHALTAGEALPETTRQTWRDRTETDIHEALGMSEVSTFVSGAPDIVHTLGTVGRPQPGRRIAILDENGTLATTDTPGMLAVHKTDPGLMLGYYRHAEAPNLPLTGDWFVTGDRASLNADDVLTYYGRSDTILTVGGYRISPEEVETALLKHPSINDTAVAAIEVKQDVSVLVAFYSAPEPIEHDELRAYISERVAGYKSPRHFVHTPAIPRHANGKLARRDLSQLWNSEH